MALGLDHVVSDAYVGAGGRYLMRDELCVDLRQPKHRPCAIRYLNSSTIVGFIITRIGRADANGQADLPVPMCSSFYRRGDSGMARRRRRLCLNCGRFGGGVAAGCIDVLRRLAMLTYCAWCAQRSWDGKRSRLALKNDRIAALNEGDLCHVCHPVCMTTERYPTNLAPKVGTISVTR